jgi:UDP-glucose 4-epimerase
MILVTGGAGYIGAHICLELLAAGHDVAVLDNLCNSSADSLSRVEQLTGRPIVFVQGDIRDRATVAGVLHANRIDAVIHLAGLKSPLQSTSDPLAYYDVNVSGAMQLVSVLAEHGVKRIVFSSSATVYGPPQRLPVTEAHPCHPTTPYGRTKRIIEQMLDDAAAADPTWRVGVLRYFNPVGAHESGLIGERASGTPNNLMPFVAQVAAGLRPNLTIHGGDFPTPDGTGIRDFIHVVDLAKAHVRAVESLDRGGFTLNLGTGVGTSVIEMVQAFEAASGRRIECIVGPRRNGDVASCYADPSAAADRLGWRASRSIDAMCADQWRWQQTLSAAKS